MVPVLIEQLPVLIELLATFVRRRGSLSVNTVFSPCGKLVLVATAVPAA